MFILIYITGYYTIEEFPFYPQKKKKKKNSKIKNENVKRDGMEVMLQKHK